MRNVEEHTQTSLEDKFPLLEIDTELTKVMPPDEVLELVNACVSLSGYSRNDIRNAFFRALSIPALDIYVDADQRCKVAIDIVVNGLENRYPDKPKLEYEWKGESSNLSELKVIDKYGNGLFTDYCIPEPSEIDGTPEVDVALEVQGAHEVPDVPEVQDAHVHINPEVVDVPGVPDAQVHNTNEAVAPEIANALEVDNAQEDADTPSIPDASEVHVDPTIPGAPEISDAPEDDSAHEVINTQIHNTLEDVHSQEDDRTEVHNVPEDSDTVEFADAQEKPSTPEVHDISEVLDDSIVGDASN